VHILFGARRRGLFLPQRIPAAIPAVAKARNHRHVCLCRPTLLS